MKKLLVAGLVLASTLVFAETASKPTPGAPAPTKLTQAQKDTIKSCYANASIDDFGRPDRNSVKQCLDKNKIVLPARQGWHDMKPEDREKMKKAFEECKAKQTTSQDKKAEHEAIHACMKQKGIEMPMRGKGHGKHGHHEQEMMN